VEFFAPGIECRGIRGFHSIYIGNREQALAGSFSVSRPFRLAVTPVDFEGCLRLYQTQRSASKAPRAGQQCLTPRFSWPQWFSFAMPIVKFVNENKEIEVPHGANLSSEARKAGVNLNTGLLGFGEGFFKYANCLGNGFCGTCAVLIAKGMDNTNPMTWREKLKFKSPIPVGDPLPGLAFVNYEDKMRLACQVRVQGDIEVQSGPKVDLFGENFFS
jgi:ferredoxin